MKYLLLTLVLGASFAYGHGDHGDPKQNLQLLTDYLESAFVEVDRDDGAQPEPSKILFKATDGHLYSIPKSRLADALARATVAAIEDHCDEHHCQGEHEPTPARKREWVKATGKRLLTFFLAPVFGFVEMAMSLPNQLSYLAAQVGVLPAAAVAAIWFPYSMLTETLESAVMGPYHWACPFFQALFWGPVLYAVFDFNLLKDVIFFRGNERGVFGRLRRAFSQRVTEWRLKKALKHIVLEEIPAIMGAKQFKELIPHPNVISEAFVASKLWPTLYELRFLKAELSPKDEAAPQNGKNFADLESIYFLRNLIEKQVDLAYEASKMGYWRRVRVKNYIGWLDRIIGVFHRSVWLGNPGAEAESWRAQSIKAILGSMKTFFKMVTGEQLLSELKSSLTATATLVSSLRDGRYADCGVDVAIAGFESAGPTTLTMSEESVVVED